MNYEAKDFGFFGKPSCSFITIFAGSPRTLIKVFNTFFIEEHLELAMATLKAAITFLKANIRRLICASQRPPRLSHHPPDLVRWIEREGGFVHHAVKLSQDTPFGFGLISTEQIPQGTDLITLPPHVPLRFESDDAPPSPLLAALARRVPGKS